MRVYTDTAMPNVLLNRWKNQPSARSSPRVTKSRRPPCGCSSRAASAGLRVSELKAEKTVETAMVTANCRKNWPVIPPMKAQGTNTAHSTSATATTGPVTSSIALRVASRGGNPCSSQRPDVLDDDDGVVHHDADGQHQPEQRQVVQREAQGRHDGEGADDGDGDGDQRDKGRPPILEDHQDYAATSPIASSSVQTTSRTDSRMKGVVS